MKLLINIKDLNNYKYNDGIPFECEQCHNIFYVMQKKVKYELKNRDRPINYCSRKCHIIHKKSGKIYKCEMCETEFYRSNSQANHKKKKSHRYFCSSSCAAQYNNAHKTFGFRRSRLEIWLEKELTQLYPNLNIKYNDRKTLLCELDIFIPSLNLAFELNGPLHYEPIFGLEKFTDIQKRDKRKLLTCAENNIELAIIDVSTLKYFKPNNAKKYLDIITNIIDSKLVLETSPALVNN